MSVLDLTPSTATIAMLKKVITAGTSCYFYASPDKLAVLEPPNEMHGKNIYEITNTFDSLVQYTMRNT